MEIFLKVPSMVQFHCKFMIMVSSNFENSRCFTYSEYCYIPISQTGALRLKRNVFFRNFEWVHDR